MEPIRGAMVKVTSDELVNSNGQQNIGKRQEQSWAHSIQQRIMRLENFMEIVRKREAVERNNWVQTRDSMMSHIRYRFPNLSMKENQGVLKRAAQYYLGDLGNSSRGDLTDTLVDKVIVLCAILSDSITHSHLDIGLIIKTINDVFRFQDRMALSSNTPETLENKLNRIESRLISLNRTAESRAAAAAAPVVAQGGFYKKNYRRSIKTNKSRKLRSRR
jgi:hypothetical protein